MPTETLREQLETLPDLQLGQLLRLLKLPACKTREETIQRILEVGESRVDGAFFQITVKKKHSQ